VRWSKTLIPTLKEIPSDAEVPSHQLMLRAGLIKQLMAGAYSYLPLGYRALRKAEAIVREEMERAGAVEIHMPALQPIDLFERTGRKDAFGNVLINFEVKRGDRKVHMALGPTHEEVITDLISKVVTTYKQLPFTLFQIQTKFRNEERPRFGVLRTSEFLMTKLKAARSAAMLLTNSCALPATVRTKSFDARNVHTQRTSNEPTPGAAPRQSLNRNRVAT